MIETFELKNFRCFTNLSISPLSRVNLITGKNNSGKTAFLEGLFLHLGATNPELPLNINLFRGVTKLQPNAQEIWGWLFTNKNFRETILSTSYDNLGKRRDLKINLDFNSLGTTNYREDTPTEIITTNPIGQQLVLSFHEGEEESQKSRVTAELQGNQIKFASNKKNLQAPFPPSIFMATRVRNQAEDAERYSRLEELGLHKQIIETMRKIEPNLERFVVSVISGVPTLRAELKSNRIIPLSYMGEGMNRLLSIILAIPICQNGLLLIDEIENGIHHSVLSRIFTSLDQLIHQFNVQLIATTHSWECIKAAYEIYAKENIYNFRLFEFEFNDGQNKVIAYDQDTLGEKFK